MMDPRAHGVTSLSLLRSGQGGALSGDGDVVKSVLVLIDSGRKRSPSHPPHHQLHPLGKPHNFYFPCYSSGRVKIHFFEHSNVPDPSGTVGITLRPASVKLSPPLLQVKRSHSHSFPTRLNPQF